MTTTPTPYIGRNEVGDHVLVAGRVELLAIVDDGEQGDPSVVLWGEDGEAVESVPLDHLGYDPGRRVTHPSMDHVRATLGALHHALPAAIGHLATWALEGDLAHSARDEAVLVDGELIVALREFAVMAKELAELRPNVDAAPDELDLERIADLLRTDHGLPNAYVEQTGGGCATVYVGDTWTDERGDDWQLAAAGPGWFTGPSWTAPRAAKADFYVGPDDQGESECYTATEDDDEATLAQRIADVVAAERVRRGVA